MSLTTSGRAEAGGLDFGLNLIFDPRIDRERHRDDVVERRFVETRNFLHGRGAHAGKIVAVNRVHHVFQFGFEKPAVGRIVGSQEHGVDCRVELGPGVIEIAILKSFLAVAESFFGLLDQKIGSGWLKGDGLRLGFFGDFLQVGQVFGLDDGRGNTGVEECEWRLE